MNEIITCEGEKEEFCAFCKCLAKQKCSACKNVYYCSREHQKLDWRIHSKNCEIVMLVENSTIGRHYIATRDIEMDEIVLMEKKPLMVAPKPGTMPVCLNCYVPLKEENAKPCKNCGWPLCLDCTTHGPECQLTMKYRESKIKIQSYSMFNIIYDSICVFRAIALREESPKDYKKLLNLQCHDIKIKNEKFDGKLLSAIHLRNAQLLKMRLQIDDLDAEEIARIIGIFVMNSYLTYTPKDYSYAAVFDKASYNAHDCRPNCRWTSRYDANSGVKITFQAIRMIPKGQSITITYTTSLSGTKNRREILRNSRYFDCTCERCNDPTEFGTMFSAVKCFEKDCTGYMLPSTFVVSKDTQIPDFVCNKCELTKPSKTIDKIVEKASMQFSKIEPKNQTALKKFIENQSNILHENHFFIVMAQIMDCVKFTENAKNLISVTDDEFLKERITLCKKLTDLLEILKPTDYATRGWILYSECSCMLELLGRVSSQTLHDKFILFKDCKKVFAESYRLLRIARNEDDVTDFEMTRLILEAMERLFSSI